MLLVCQCTSSTNKDILLKVARDLQNIVDTKIFGKRYKKVCLKRINIHYDEYEPVTFIY